MMTDQDKYLVADILRIARQILNMETAPDTLMRAMDKALSDSLYKSFDSRISHLGAVEKPTNPESNKVFILDFKGNGNNFNEAVEILDKMGWSSNIARTDTKVGRAKFVNPRSKVIFVALYGPKNIIVASM